MRNKLDSKEILHCNGKYKIPHKKSKDCYSMSWHHNKKAKIVIVCLGIIMCVCVMLFLLYSPIWLYSFGAAFLSYIILTIISFWSIKTKVNQKIIQASQHNTLATQKESSKCVLGDPETSNHIDTNTFYKQHSGQPSISRKQEQKKILKFLDPKGIKPNRAIKQE